MNRRLAGAALLAAAIVALSGCASTALNAQWVNPQAGNKLPVKSVMVMGINRDSTARRIYEDAMVAQLSARGIKAVQSYKSVPEEGPAEQQKIQAAVAAAGADSVLISRTVSVTNEVRVSPGYVAGPPWGFGWPGFYGYYHSYWSAAYAFPERLYRAERAGRYSAVRRQGVCAAVVGFVDDDTTGSMRRRFRTLRRRSAQRWPRQGHLVQYVATTLSSRISSASGRLARSLRHAGRPAISARRTTVMRHRLARNGPYFADV